MEKGRGGRPARRRTQPYTSGSLEDAELMDPRTGLSPAVFSQTPQTAPQMRRGVRQGSMPFVHSDGLPASSPLANTAMSLRKRTRTFGADGNVDELDESRSKGTHNLRKRAKIDYSAIDFEDELPEIAMAAPRTATRRRRADSEAGDGDSTGSSPQVGVAAHDIGNLSGDPAYQRRISARNAAERAENESVFPLSDDVVQDTIEVVGDSSDLQAADELSGADIKPDSPTHVTVSHYDSSPSRGRRDINYQSELLFEQDRASKNGDHVAGHFHGFPDHHYAPDRNGVDNTQSTSSLSEDLYSAARQLKYAQEAQTSQRRGLVEELTIPSSRRRSVHRYPATNHFSATSLGPSTPDFSRQGNERSDASNLSASAQAQSLDSGASPLRRNGSFLSRASGASRDLVNPDHADAVVDFEGKGPASRRRSRLSHGALNDLGNRSTWASKQGVSPDEANLEDNGTYSAVVENGNGHHGRYAWSHLTPYVDGEFSLHPEPNTQTATADDEANENDQGADGMGDFEGQDYGDGVEESVEEAKKEAFRDIYDVPDSQEGASLQELNGAASIKSGIPTPTPQSPRPRSPSQASAAPTGANTPVPSDRSKTGPAAAKQPMPRQRKQFRFPMLRDPAELQEHLQHHKSLPLDDLYALLSHANDCLLAWQDEWQSCARKVDDYENAKRRAAQDAEFEKKTADLEQFSRFESYLEKDFDLRGYRAPIKEKEEGTFYQRWQDKVMASAYGFEYDPHASKVGQQDPVAQKEGIMAGRQLRSQPQQTAKAAEAGDAGDVLVVTGKRARNPPKLYEGFLQDESRSATPVDKAARPGTRRRGRPPAFRVEEEHPDSDAASVAKKPGPKKRGPKPGRRLSALTDADVSIGFPNEGADEDALAESEPPPKRRRGRQPKSALAASMTRSSMARDADRSAPAEWREPPKRGRPARKRGGRGRLPHLKLHGTRTTEDFINESRPTTSSSEATVSDNESTYEIRGHKRRRTSRDEALTNHQSPQSALEPQKKRPRINLKSSAGGQVLGASDPQQVTRSDRILSELASAPLTDSPVPGQKSRLVTFRHLGRDRWMVGQRGHHDGRDSTAIDASSPTTYLEGSPSIPVSGVSSAAASQAGEEAKDYSTMTKSEKMSASMKKRWMNGSMQNAVNKRKATLAAKKAAAANATATITTNTSAPTPQPPPSQAAEPRQYPTHQFVNGGPGFP